MKLAAAALISLLFIGSPAFAQSSLWVEDLTTPEVEAAVKAGKTTAIYYAAGLHNAGPAVALGKHQLVIRTIAQKVAEKLGDALILPVDPYAPGIRAADPVGDPRSREGNLRFAGGVSNRNVTMYSAIWERITAYILSTGFKRVLIAGEHGSGQVELKKVAQDLDAEWKSKGVRIFYMPVHPEFDEKALGEYLTKAGVPTMYHNDISNTVELMAVEPKPGYWVRYDLIPAEYRKVCTVELGKTFIDMKVNIIVDAARRMSAEQPAASR